MNVKAKLSSCCMAAAVLAFTASGSWAAATVCNTKTVGSGTYKAIIAVASNFYGPAQDMVDAFQQTTGGANTAITICQNSTAHLLAEINNGTDLPSSAFPTDPGFPRYGLFMAANTAAPISLQSSTGNTAYLYAKGVPVFFALQTKIPTVGGLITGLGSATEATISGTVSSSQAINTSNTQTVAVADPTAAPYGLAATTILHDMALIPSTTGFTIPSWMSNPLYANIDLTYTSVINGVTKSGFVAESQICNIKSSTTDIRFTGYEIPQDAILLKSSDTVAAALNSYIQGQISSQDWNSFLLAHCYDTL